MSVRKVCFVDKKVFGMLNKAVFGHDADAFNNLADVFGKRGHKGLSTIMEGYGLASHLSNND